MKNPSISHGDVRRAMDRLAPRYPLLAGVLATWRLVESLDHDTMAVGIEENRLTLWFNPDFVASCTTDERCGVLCHECYHVLFGHIFHVPAEDENVTARIIAEEVTVNEWVDLPLPGAPILLGDYPFLPELEDTETRYERLRQAGMEEADLPDAMDDHAQWASAATAPAWVRAAVVQQVKTVLAGLSAAERLQIPAAVMAALARAGVLAGVGAQDLPGADPAKVAWQTVLRRFVGQVRERRPVYGRPPRRFPEMAGILPAHGRTNGKLKVLAVIDTSGSVDDFTLAAISSELAAMSKVAEIIVVECDAVIQRVYPYTAPLQSVAGRGGTDLRPPFESALLRQHRPDLVLYFTDGYGPAPAAPPPVPTCWVLLAGGVMPCAWGREIRMDGAAATGNAGPPRG